MIICQSVTKAPTQSQSVEIFQKESTVQIFCRAIALNIAHLISYKGMFAMIFYEVGNVG